LLRIDAKRARLAHAVAERWACFRLFDILTDEKAKSRARMQKPYLKLCLSGIASCTLYLLLYLHEAEVMRVFTRTDGLYPLLSVIAALIFSFIHGAFGGYFWVVLGITGRRNKG
jgi:hypothetical protein